MSDVRLEERVCGKTPVSTMARPRCNESTQWAGTRGYQRFIVFGSTYYEPVETLSLFIDAKV